MVYTMKSIITYDEIPIPKCIYAQKNIIVDPLNLVPCKTPSFNSGRDLICDQTTPKEMTELVTRQEKVLLQLEQLQEHINKMKKHNDNSWNSAIASKKTITLPSEIVINVSTEHLPVSLALMHNLLVKDISLNIKYHIHSTVAPNGTKRVDEFLKLLRVAEDQKNKPPLHIRLIFKDVDSQIEVITNSNKGVPIIGDVNALRYLARLLTASLLYPEDHDSDALLDACHLMQRLSTPVKEKQILLETVTANLERHNFLTGESFTIVDVALYSVLKNNNIPGSNTPFIQKWMQRVLTAVK